MKAQYNTKDLILALSSMPSKVKEFGQQNPEFEAIIQFILDSYNFYDDNEERGIPTMNNISKAVGMTPPRAKKMIDQIYFSIVDAEAYSPTSFTYSKTRVEFYITGFYEERCSFKTQLEIIPRKGESIHVDYFKPLLGTSYFYVHDVTHRFEDEEHIIVLYLREGMYNSYMDLRIDQGRATDELAWNYFELSEDELKEKLGVYKKPWG